jgi:hypothetical protein
MYNNHKTRADFFVRSDLSRALSVMMQTHIVASLDNVESVMEVGPGRYNMAALLRHFGIRYESLDTDSQYEVPDYLCSLEQAEIANRYDAVVAFQVLEHFPREEFSPLLKKLSGWSKNHVVISLPCSTNYLNLSFGLRLGEETRFFKGSYAFQKLFEFGVFDQARRRRNREANAILGSKRHQWEVGDSGCSNQEIVAEMKSIGLREIKVVRNHFYPYHKFFCSRVSED